ncbi:MAG TPA: serine/threonine-protein kinase [Planctomycetota bacterium]|nr:serine/threonine-protein kinase [Planctomycetota bacterium]
MNERRAIDEDAVAEALGDLETRRARGESPSVFEYRDRLGESHTALMEVLEAEAVLDEVLDPPAEECLPRDFGPYTLLRELGRGATGVVYEGLHRQLGRRAAIKVLRRGFDADASSRDRFRREMRACAKVRHPHIVEIHEAGEVDGRPFYAMALAEGRTLSALIKAGEAPAPKALARSMADIADALSALHATGVVHRDVKPSNLMVRGDGDLLLADFGHARVGDGMGLTVTGETLGTPHYMSPEQLLDAKGGVDERSDVYALGATLYEALAGQPVFPARDFPTLARMILEQRPEPLHKVAPHVPAPLEGIVMKALEKRPEDRQATAAELRDELRAFAADEHVTSHPVGTIVRFGRYVRQHALPIAAALAVTLGGAWLWTHRPATMRIESFPPGAEVLVAGTSRGTTPVEVSLSPGSYDVTLRMAGFADRTRRVALGAGGERDLELALEVHENAAGTDFGPRDRLLEAVGVEIARFETRRGERAGGGDKFTVLWPRGDVRLEDLADWAAEAIDYKSGSVLEFVRGGKVLYSEPFHAELPAVLQPIPAAVLGALKEGDVVRFGLREARARQGQFARDQEAEFRIVRSDASEAIAAAERRVGEQPAVVLAELRARLLLEKGLRTAALRHLEGLPDDVKSDPRILALTYRVYDELRLGASGRGKAVRDRIDGLPQAVQVALYGEVDASVR